MSIFPILFRHVAAIPRIIIPDLPVATISRNGLVRRICSYSIVNSSINDFLQVQDKPMLTIIYVSFYIRDDALPKQCLAYSNISKDSVSMVVRTTVLTLSHPLYAGT